jgi:hypothetical protein
MMDAPGAGQVMAGLGRTPARSWNCSNVSAPLGSTALMMSNEAIAKTVVALDFRCHDIIVRGSCASSEVCS